MTVKRKLTVVLILVFMQAAASARAYVLLPAPQKIIDQGELYQVDAEKVFMTDALNSHDPRIVKGLMEFFPALSIVDMSKPPEPGAVLIHATETMDEIARENCPLMGCMDMDPSKFGPQEYFLGINKMGDAVFVLILFKRSPVENGVSEYYGEYYATRTLKQLYENDTLPRISIHDWPEFHVRGVLEGFYGKPWPKEGRYSMLPWMGDYKFNIYLYTPKDDHKLRFGWRLSLNDKEKAEIKYVNDLAADHFVKYCWSLSPGMSINFSSDKDLKAAYKKLKSVLEIGVRCFSLAFDDVSPVLSPVDRDVYKTYWEGQVEFSNRLMGRLLEEYPETTFAFVPNDYWGNLAWESEYLRYVGEHLDQRISIGWTGNKIIPETVSPADAIFYEYYIKRQPFLGDNYPVTDNITLAGGRLSLGPLRSRDARLFRYIKGYASNASPLPETSKPAFLTIADYTWNPFAYDADRSWLNTCKIIAGEDKYEPFYFFSKQSESSFIWKYDAVDLHERTRAVVMAFTNQPDYEMAAAAAQLRDMLARFTGIGAELEATRNSYNAPIYDEMPLWIEKLEMYGRVGLKTLDLLEKKYKGESVAATDIDAVEAEWQKGEENKAVMTKMVMHNFMRQALALLRGQELPKSEELKTMMTDE